MSPEEIAVLDANSAFYRSFARRDLAALEAAWARGPAVACIHPGWDVLRGREAVMASWRSILEGDPSAIACAEASAEVRGDVAWVTCREIIPGAPPLAATNVFVREDGAWRLVLHHGGMVAQERPERPPGARA